MTEDQEKARRIFSATCDLPVDRWKVIGPDDIEVGYWYDWCDTATRKHGQCCMGDGGIWKQEPRGSDPVVLEYRKGGWK